MVRETAVSKIESENDLDGVRSVRTAAPSDSRREGINRFSRKCAPRTLSSPSPALARARTREAEARARIIIGTKNNKSSTWTTQVIMSYAARRALAERSFVSLVTLQFGILAARVGKGTPDSRDTFVSLLQK